MNAPSPFLPNTSIRFAWDSTCLGALKTCPRLYYYQYIEGWTTEGESIHLRFGQEFHKALEDFDRKLADGVKREQAIREVLVETLARTGEYEPVCVKAHDRCDYPSEDCQYCERKWVPWSPDEDTRAGKYKNRKTLFRLVLDYLDHYEDDQAQTFIKADGIPAVELSFRFELDWGPGVNGNGKQYIKEPREDNAIREFTQPYLLCGHLDRVVTFNDSLFFMDRKTSMTTLGSYYFDQYSPHNQMSLYTLASQVILGSPIKGGIIDAAQILLSEPSRFVRGIIYRTPDQIEEWLDDLKGLLAQAEAYAIADHWPMNDTACGNYGGCKFREVCSKSPQVRDIFLKSHFTKQAPEDMWNPLKSRG